MQTSRLLISTLTAIGVIGLAGIAVAQTGTTTPSPGGTTTTITPPAVTTTTETDADRMNRERMNAPATSGTTTPAAIDPPMNTTGQRDADGNLIAQADRN